MSGDHAKREIMTGEKAASSGRTLSRESGNKHKEESSSSIKSHRRGDKKKKMKKVVYYETDSSSPSTSNSESSTTSKRHERKKYSKMPLRYPRISRRAPLLSVPLGKPPYFDGEDYCMWSDKMRHHLTSLHESIWDIVEFGAQAPKVGDKDYDLDEAAQIRHFNSQTTSMLPMFSSLVVSSLLCMLRISIFPSKFSIASWKLANLALSFSFFFNKAIIGSSG
jgi:hypothetical protein